MYALYFGLLEEAEEAPVIEFLEKRGFSCGVMLSYYLLLALARRGRYESVYRLLLNDSDHGWCNMLREGATTCFEAVSYTHLVLFVRICDLSDAPGGKNLSSLPPECKI